MSSGVPSDPEAITAVLDRFDAVQAEVASLPFDALTAPQALTVKDRLEMVSRRQAAVDHRLTHQLTSQASPVELGGTSWTDVLSNRLRIGRGEARRRLDEADDLAPRTTLTGEPLAPALPNVAAAQAAGTIGAEHVRIVRRFFADLPAAVDIETRQACEVDLARIVGAHTPDALQVRIGMPCVALWVSLPGTGQQWAEDTRRTLAEDTEWQTLVDGAGRLFGGAKATTAPTPV